MMTSKAQADIRRKLKILNHGKENGNVSKTCRYFGISREAYYKWKRDYDARGEAVLINSKPCPQNPKLRIPPAHRREDNLPAEELLFGPASYLLVLEKIS
jgi:transposase-like protein